MSNTANFNNTTPAALPGTTNVTFQKDGSGNVSACVAASGGGTANNIAGGAAGNILTQTAPSTTGFYTPTQALAALMASLLTSLGDTIYSAASGVVSRLAGPTTIGTYVLSESPVSAGNPVAPAWLNLVTWLTSALTTPPAIGGTTPAAGTFFGLKANGDATATTPFVQTLVSTNSGATANIPSGAFVFMIRALVSGSNYAGMAFSVVPGTGYVNWWRAPLTSTLAATNWISEVQVDPSNGGFGMPNIFPTSVQATGNLATTNGLVQGGMQPNARTVTANYQITYIDNFVFVDCTSGPVTVTLPTAGVNPGNQWIIKKVDASANAMSIATLSGKVIDNAAAPIVTSATNYPAYRIVFGQQGGFFNYWTF